MLRISAVITAVFLFLESIVFIKKYTSIGVRDPKSIEGNLTAVWLSPKIATKGIAK